MLTSDCCHCPCNSACADKELTLCPIFLKYFTRKVDIEPRHTARCVTVLDRQYLEAVVTESRPIWRVRCSKSSTVYDRTTRSTCKHIRQSVSSSAICGRAELAVVRPTLYRVCDTQLQSSQRLSAAVIVFRWSPDL